MCRQQSNVFFVNCHMKSMFVQFPQGKYPNKLAAMNTHSWNKTWGCSNHFSVFLFPLCVDKKFFLRGCYHVVMKQIHAFSVT